jgi:hypothetical protein
MKTTNVLPALMILFLGACVSTSTIHLENDNQRSPIRPNMVKIYRTANNVPGKYDEIALISASGNARLVNQSKLVDKLKQKAAALGANGIILDILTEPSDTSKILGTYLGIPAKRSGQVIAIFVHNQF